MLSTSMSSDTLLVEYDGPGGSGSPGSGVAVVTFNRPQVRNALNAETLERLRRVMLELKDDESVRVVILTGAGDKAFVAGADIHELAVQTATSARAFALAGQRVFDVVEHLGKPVIAAINGYALGGGCELAMACTLRLATDDSRLGLPEVKLGVIPGYGGTQRLPRLVGRSAALKLLLTGEIINAQEALRIGLVDEVVPAPELMQRAESLARSIAAQAPLAISEVLQVVDEGINLPLDLALPLEAERFGRLCGTADKAEGTKAFLEKRTPAWKSN
jgi:enoyl-CoA hydratase